MLACLVSTSGCVGTSAPSKPVVEFPNRQALAAIRRQAAPKLTLEGRGDLGAGFATEAVPPGMLGERVRKPETPWEQVLANVLPRDGSLAMTEELHCVAREIGRFFLERGVHPANGLRRFLLGRCGSTAPDVMPIASRATLPAHVDDAQAHATWKEPLRDLLRRQLPTGPGGVGIWFGRDGDQAVVLVVHAARPARLEPVDPRPDPNGWVVLRGAMIEPAGALYAYVNRGEFGVERCDVDLGVKLPAFRVYCPVDPADSEAVIEILASAPGRVLARVVARALARRADALPREFDAQRYGAQSEVGDPQAFGNALLAGLNEVRARAGLGPLERAVAQSNTAQELAPHYFVAEAESRGADVDTIALGLLAGWDVGGMIRDAALLTGIVAPTRDASQWLGTSLAAPSGRVALMNPDARQVAIGAVVEANAIGAVVTSYELHENEDHQANVNLFFDRVVRARERLGLPPPKRLGPLMEPMAKELGRVRQGEISPASALRNVMDVGAAGFGLSMRGYQIEAIDVESLELPDEILRAPVLLLEIGVTHHRPPGAAWAQYVVLIAYVDPGKRT